MTAPQIEQVTTENSTASVKTVSFAGSPNEGDLLVFYASVPNSGTDYDPAPPAGVSTAIAPNAGAFRTVAVFYKIAGPSETNAYDFTITGSAAWTVMARRYSGGSGASLGNTVVVHDPGDVASVSGSVTASAGSIVTAWCYSSNTGAKSWSAGWLDQLDSVGLRRSSAWKTSAGGTETATMSLDAGTNNRLSLAIVEFTTAPAPTISDVDGDNDVNQYQLVNIDVSGYTEAITSVLFGTEPVVSIPDNDPSDDVIQVRVPGNLATGTYDVTVSGATESDTISGVTYTQTHPVNLPAGAYDSNSVLQGQSLGAGYAGDAYMDNPGAPYEITGQGGTAVPAGALMAFKAPYTSWADAPIQNNVDDYLEAPAQFEGWMRQDFQRLYSDGTTATWSVEIEVAAPDLVSPYVTSVAVPAAGTLVPGNNLDLTVNLNEAANVTTTGGTPRIPLTIGPATRYASYVSGTGTAAHLYRYVVQAGDLDEDGIAVGAAVDLNGGVIQDGAGNDLAPALNNVGDTSGVLVDGVGPTISINSITTTDTTPVVSGSAGDAVSLTLVVNAVTYNPVPSGGSWSQQLPELPLGDYTMTLDGEDALGNAAMQRQATLSVVDEIPSTVTSVLRPVLLPILSPVLEVSL